MKHSGWRKPTPGLCRANALAEDGERISIPKARALLAVRRVAAAIGLRAGDLLLLDTLAAFTKTIDWDEGSRPLVWPSNIYLVEVTGLSVSAVKRHMRKLVELGLVTCKDSPNGKRWGRRDDAGRIVEAYGFDLAPLAARTCEFEALYEILCRQREKLRHLKRQFTVLRRTVWSLIHAVMTQVDQTCCALDLGFWMDMRQRYEVILSDIVPAKLEIDELEIVCAIFEDMQAEAEQAFRATGEPEAAPSDGNEIAVLSGWNITEKDENPDPRRAGSGLHIRITNQPQPVKRNGDENASEAGAGGFAASGIGQASGDREVTGGEISSNVSGCVDDIARSPAPNGAAGRRRAGLAEGEVTIEAILFACPTFAEMVHGLGNYVRSWHELIAAADRIRPMIGISVDAWQSARSSLGPHGAAAAIALITDKYSEGSVASPGGYLRGLCQKALAGKLQLARSVYGRLAERQLKH